MDNDLENSLPLVSILMPVYNCLKYIDESLDSIINQTYQKIEIIIINDGCNDGTEEILKNFAKINKNVKLINQKNQGYCDSINNGIKLCNGKYVARMDADDVMISNRIERQVHYMENNPEISILGTAIYYIDSKGIKSRLQRFPNKNSINERILDESPVAHPSALIRKTVFDKVGKFRKNLYPSEDYDYWLRAYSLGLIIDNLKTPLLLYRVHNQNTSSNNTVKRALSTIAAQKGYLLRLLNQNDNLDSQEFDFSDYFNQLDITLKPSPMEIFSVVHSNVENYLVDQLIKEYSSLKISYNDTKFRIKFLLRIAFYYFVRWNIFLFFKYLFKGILISPAIAIKIIINKINGSK